MGRAIELERYIEIEKKGKKERERERKKGIKERKSFMLGYVYMLHRG